MKFAKHFLGVQTGDIYPTTFGAGDECPEELLDAAGSVGALAEEPTDEKFPDDKKAPETQADKKAPETK
jgi:hypothetical protein